MSKFLFHVKFANRENYLHEHELYEVMRSRSLYQVQFEVRANYRKKMRNLAISEKANSDGYESRKKLFLQKMRERMEQADKLREMTESLKRKAASYRNTVYKKRERRYIPITMAPTRFELPTIVSRTASRHSNRSLLHHPTQRPTHLPPLAAHQSTSTMQLPMSRSASAALSGRTVAVSPAVSALDRTSDESKSREDAHKDLTKQTRKHRQSKALVVGKDYPKTKTILSPSKKEVEQGSSDKGTEDESENLDTVPPLPPILNSTGLASADNLREDSEAASKKCAEWTQQHGLVGNHHEADDRSYQRLLIDRPSKWQLSHVTGEALQIGTSGVRDGIDTYLSKSKQMDIFLQNKQQLKQTSQLSLPELNTKPRSMGNLVVGGTTPDGRLILTKADYDDYLANFRKARNARLDKVKRKSKRLSKQVRDFKTSSDLDLHDDKDILLIGSC